MKNLDKIGKAAADIIFRCCDSGKPYTVSLSCGAYIAEANFMCRIEDFLRVSDARMYEEKMKKKAGRS